MVQNNQQPKKNAQNQNMNQRQRLTGNQNLTGLPLTAGQKRRQRLRELRRNAQNRGRLAPLANTSTGVSKLQILTIFSNLATRNLHFVSASLWLL
jgi:hypothetical protein